VHPGARRGCLCRVYVRLDLERDSWRLFDYTWCSWVQTGRCGEVISVSGDYTYIACVAERLRDTAAASFIKQPAQLLHGNRAVLLHLV